MIYNVDGTGTEILNKSAYNNGLKPADALGETTTTNTTVQTSTATGTTANLISLSNYSNTAVFAANKILPSIVGIEVSYTATSNSIFSFGTPSSQTATAVIVTDKGYVENKTFVFDDDIDLTFRADDYSFYFF